MAVPDGGTAVRSCSGANTRATHSAKTGIRGLLQRHALLEPLTIDGVGAVVLQLLDSGDLAEIPVPVGGPRRFGAKPRTGGRTSQRRPGAAVPRGMIGVIPGPPRPTVGRAEGAGPGRQDQRRRATRRRPRMASARSRLACPLCGSEVVEQEKSFGCSGWKRAAGSRSGRRSRASRSVRAAEALLRRGRTPLLRGFRSKAGNRFEARLKLDGGEVRFEFENEDRRRPPGGRRAFVSEARGWKRSPRRRLVAISAIARSTARRTVPGGRSWRHPARARPRGEPKGSRRSRARVLRRAGRVVAA